MEAGQRVDVDLAIPIEMALNAHAADANIGIQHLTHDGQHDLATLVEARPGKFQIVVVDHQSGIRIGARGRLESERNMPGPEKLEPFGASQRPLLERVMGDDLVDHVPAEKLPPKMVGDALDMLDQNPLALAAIGDRIEPGRNRIPPDMGVAPARSPVVHREIDEGLGRLQTPDVAFRPDLIEFQFGARHDHVAVIQKGLAISGIVAKIIALDHRAEGNARAFGLGRPGARKTEGGQRGPGGQNGTPC